ncbi:MAG: zinc ribbon domain-containing protein [Verrucomicrobiales bacterium]
MIPEIEQLLIIQDRDQKLKELNSDIERLPLEELQAKERLKAATTSVEISEKAFMENEIAMKNIELDIDTRKDSITKLKVQQMETKKNDEFAVMEHSINNYQSEIVKLEDSQLELMEKGESLSETLQQNKDNLAKDQKIVDSELLVIAERKKHFSQKIDDLSIDREKISSSVEPDLLDRYNRIFKSKKSDAVSELINDICSGCHMKVTPSTALAVRAEKVVTTCDQCGRILYI